MDSTETPRGLIPRPAGLDLADSSPHVGMSVSRDRSAADD